MKSIPYNPHKLIMKNKHNHTTIKNTIKNVIIKGKFSAQFTLTLLSNFACKSGGVVLVFQINCSIKS